METLLFIDQPFISPVAMLRTKSRSNRKYQMRQEKMGGKCCLKPQPWNQGRIGSQALCSFERSSVSPPS
jgi:hypothetical protein